MSKKKIVRKISLLDEKLDHVLHEIQSLKDLILSLAGEDIEPEIAHHGENQATVIEPDVAAP